MKVSSRCHRDGETAGPSAEGKDRRLREGGMWAWMCHRKLEKPPRGYVFKAGRQGTTLTTIRECDPERSPEHLHSTGAGSLGGAEGRDPAGPGLPGHRHTTGRWY